MTAPTTVLLIDSTGRGHALCDLFVRTDPAVRVFYGPGNQLIAHDRIVSVPEIELTEPDTALAFLQIQPVDLVFVSNIDALSSGYVDRLRAAGHQVIGPTAMAAELEASKERAKRFLTGHQVPTAQWRSFDDPVAATAYIRELDGPCVVKADGLTPDGDGSHVCDTATEAELALGRMVVAADSPVVIEERMYGRELSIFALLDHRGYLLFPTAMDYNRCQDGDAGKNCDGMGSIAPHPDDGPALLEQIRELLDAIVNGLHTDALDYTGFLYVGCMITDQGLRVVELNARFGDSEAEVVLPGIQSSFSQLCGAILVDQVAGQELAVDGVARCSVALTQGCLDPNDPAEPPGWPFGSFATGQPVRGLADVDPCEATVYFANLAASAAGPVTSGGRVAHVVGAGPTSDIARDRAYRQLKRIRFPGLRYRTDIGILIDPLLSVFDDTVSSASTKGNS